MSVVFANAKINLSLAITDRRGDGYHNLVSLAVPVQLCDRITICEAEKDCFTSNDKTLEQNNIIAKAVAYIKRLVPKSFHIALEKNIPVMAGFGGGSSDAVAVLKFLNSYYALGLDDRILHTAVLSFGADCPFFIKNEPAILTGVGEIISEIGCSFQSNLARYNILLFKPDFSVSTSAAYQRIRPELYIPRNRAMELTSNLVDAINNFACELPLFNTFSEIVFKEHGELSSLRERLPCPMMLSGSGSGCFCVYKDSSLESEIITAIKSHFGSSVFIKKCNLL
jgi:4-diphosphocytidyl-2-C-methyl-D-erythritol kinase